MKCFYHKSDLDGHCSGAIVKMKYPECEMIGVDYSDKLADFEASMTGDHMVFVVDFSFSVDEMKRLNIRHKLIWIDHHKSAIEKMEECYFDGIKNIGKAGCELTWEYLYPDKEMPVVVRLLGRYDVWDHTEDNVLPFQYGMREVGYTLPDGDIWKSLLVSNFQVIDIENKGRIILAYQQKQDEIYAKGMSFETKFEGLRAIAINKAFCNSKIFDSVYDPEKHDIMIVFGINSEGWKYSLYSTKKEVDVSVLATKYGGGGHAGAAGFYSNDPVL